MRTRTTLQRVPMATQRRSASSSTILSSCGPNGLASKRKSEPAKNSQTDSLPSSPSCEKPSHARQSSSSRRTAKSKRSRPRSVIATSHHRKITAELTGELEQARKAAREIPKPPRSKQSGFAADDNHDRLAHAEAYADSLRQKFQDILANQEDLEADRNRLQNALTDALARNRQLSDDLETANQANLDLDRKLVEMGETHAEDMRILRFELGQAQETVVANRSAQQPAGIGSRRHARFQGRTRAHVVRYR